MQKILIVTQNSLEKVLIIVQNSLEKIAKKSILRNRTTVREVNLC